MGLHAGKIYNGEPNPCKMTVWSVEPKGKSVVVKLTSSKKSANGWETDFSMNCCFVKEAAKHAINLKEKDKIIVKSFEVQKNIFNQHLNHMRRHTVFFKK